MLLIVIEVLAVLYVLIGSVLCYRYVSTSLQRLREQKRATTEAQLSGPQLARKREQEAIRRGLPIAVIKIQRDLVNDIGNIVRLTNWFFDNPWTCSYVEGTIDSSTGTYLLKADADGCYVVRNFDPGFLSWAKIASASVHGFRIISIETQGQAGPETDIDEDSNVAD